MKLIIKEYLASLKERNELDALLPDLLSQMGLQILSAPSIGNRQYGVDISAFGSIEDGPPKIYLFSIKSGHLGRQDWDSGNSQDLRPSLNEIRDVYIPTHIPVEFKNFPIEICLTFGGDLKQELELNIAQYEKLNSTDTVSFTRWGGDRIAGFLEKYLFNEQLFLNEEVKSLLRKSLALVDQPEVSFANFKSLLSFIFTGLESKDVKEHLTSLRQCYLALGILNSWCEGENNLESAFLSSERLILLSWTIFKLHATSKNQNSKKVKNIFNSILMLYFSINQNYLDKILKHCNKLHALSAAVHPNSEVDVNLKLFDILGKTALFGLWSNWFYNRLYTYKQEEVFQEKALEQYEELSKSIKQLILNNPILFQPYKDEQAIEISLAILFLLENERNDKDINSWLTDMTHIIYESFRSNRRYPSTLNEYLSLIQHPSSSSEMYRKSVTKGSILYPLLAFFSYYFQNTELLNILKSMVKEYIPECTMQIWNPDEYSEEHFYKNTDIHGTALTGISFEELDTAFKQIKSECKENQKINDLSAIKYEFSPLILTACRHYRLPVPFQYFLSMLSIPLDN
ncbi:hypothetical protein R4615_06665 [Acinetobacter baumannii]|nr:hypothetical protein [Acinetobacter baumannii]